MWETYEALGGGVGRGKTTRSLVGVDNQPRGAVLKKSAGQGRGGVAGGAYDVVETLSSTETSRSSANDENVDVAVAVSWSNGELAW